MRCLRVLGALLIFWPSLVEARLATNLNDRNVAGYIRSLYTPPSANIQRVDPRLVDIARQAAAVFPYRVEVAPHGGYNARKSGTKNHPGGYALDFIIYDENGNMMGNYQNPKTFRTYEKFAQTMRQIQQQKYPELSKDFRFGGYFGGRFRNDQMHVDINPTYAGATGLGDWQNGLSAQGRRLMPGALSSGMGDTMMANLASLGYTGPGAVQKFQADNGLKPDGIIGPQTMKAIAQSIPAGSGSALAAHLIDPNVSGAGQQMDLSPVPTDTHPYGDMMSYEDATRGTGEDRFAALMAGPTKIGSPVHVSPDDYVYDSQVQRPYDSMTQGLPSFDLEGVKALQQQTAFNEQGDHSPALGMKGDFRPEVVAPSLSYAGFDDPWTAPVDDAVDSLPNRLPALSADAGGPPAAARVPTPRLRETAMPLGRKLGMWDTGDDVRTMQGQLLAAGSDPGKLDGIFGPKTLRALASYQRVNTDRVGPVDGVAGPRTQMALAADTSSHSGPGLNPPWSGVPSWARVVDASSIPNLQLPSQAYLRPQDMPHNLSPSWRSLDLNPHRDDDSGWSSAKPWSESGTHILGGGTGTRTLASYTPPSAPAQRPGVAAGGIGAALSGAGGTRVSGTSNVGGGGGAGVRLSDSGGLRGYYTSQDRGDY